MTSLWMLNQLLEVHSASSVINFFVVSTRLAFKKTLKPSHGVLQLLKKNFYSVLLLHLLKPLFSLFHGLQALSIFVFCFT